MTNSTPAERIAILEQRVAGHDREMRDIKVMLASIDAKLDALTAAENQRIGAIRTGIWVIASGILASVGAGVMGAWHFFSGTGG